MVEVYKAKEPQKKINFGEIIKETPKTFKIHSSHKKFSKRSYIYKRVI